MGLKVLLFFSSSFGVVSDNFGGDGVCSVFGGSGGSVVWLGCIVASLHTSFSGRAGLSVVHMSVRLTVFVSCSFFCFLLLFLLMRRCWCCCTNLSFF